jgi:hypothetical protein
MFSLMKQLVTAQNYATGGDRGLARSQIKPQLVQSGALFGSPICFAMLFRLAAILTIASAITLTALPARSQGTPQPKLPTMELRAGMHVIQAELASTAASRQLGLMWRQVMGPNEGMLFVFEAPGPQCFWMKNTLLPLSIAFLADDGTIVNIADMKPLDETSHCSARPVRFALEMHQGWFAKRGFKAGSKIESAKGWASK